MNCPLCSEQLEEFVRYACAPHDTLQRDFLCTNCGGFLTETFTDDHFTCDWRF